MKYQKIKTLFLSAKASVVQLVPTLMAAPLLAISLPQLAVASADQLSDSERLDIASYEAAKRALKKGNTQRFFRLRNQLETFPLTPYLDSAWLRTQFKHLPVDSVHSFLDFHRDDAVAKELKNIWLSTLALKKEWNLYLEEFDDSNTSSHQLCNYYRALYETGQKDAALAAMPGVWLTGKSLPKSCDLMIKRWKRKKLLTADLIHERMVLALKAKNYGLASYLVRQMPKSKRKASNLYRRVYRYPKLVEKTSMFRGKDTGTQATVLMGLERLASRNPTRAGNLVAKYQKIHTFGFNDLQPVYRKIAASKARKHHNDLDEWMLLADPLQQDLGLLEGHLRAALQKADWQTVTEVTHRLRILDPDDDTWQYWQARAMMEQTPGSPIAQQKLETLSENRSYYGFIAAEVLNKSHTLSNQPVPVSDIQIERVESNQELKRARLFFLMGKVKSARREWNSALNTLTVSEQRAAATLANSWGWHFPAIKALVDTKFWNDLSIRFPLAHFDSFIGYANKREIPAPWVYAIARQESAFQVDARSPVGAMGLMQLMPGTAKHVTRKAKMKRFKLNHLLQPKQNVEIGSLYLKQMLEKFDGNRVFATAAYNAGPHRVKRWLKEKPNLDLDVWIETIPYTETRRYVKNVLTYAVIYGYRIGVQQKVTDYHSQQQVALSGSNMPDLWKLAFEQSDETNRL